MKIEKKWVFAAIVVVVLIVVLTQIEWYTQVKHFYSEGKDGKTYQKGYQQFGGKLWKCNDDPNDLSTVPCGPDDYSLWIDCIRKKIKYNEDYDCPTTDSWQLKRLKKEVITSCPYASACGASKECGVRAHSCK